MKLYIETENNQIKNHPAFEENLIQAFGLIPNNWVLFERIEQPIFNVYQLYEGVTYEWLDGIVKDVHHVRNMTNEEKLAKQNEIKESWNNDGFKSWVFDEATCSFEAPIKYPNDGLNYYWDEVTTSWIENNSKG
jgi:hypothetical protein